MSPSSRGRPFRLVPWDADFLRALKGELLAGRETRPGVAAVIFPHDRPRRYLTYLFRHDPDVPRPCPLPVMLTVGEVMRAFREAADPAIRREARRLDRIALIEAAVRRLAETDEALCRRLAETDQARFFSWGGLLADVLEECLIQGLEPDDLRYAEGEVAPLGAALLGSLGRIFQEYRRDLDRLGLYTPGLDAFVAAEAAGRPQILLPPQLQGRSVFLAGFSALTGTEDRLFRRLWEEGARICLHADPALAETAREPGDPEPRDQAAPGEKRAAHWACADIARWIAAWNAPVDLAIPPVGNKPRLHFFAGYDLHSQLQAAAADLQTLPLPDADVESAGETAVVLTHSGALLPALHELPRKECNISLGYPLDHSLLFRLLASVLAVRARRRPDGTTHWRALLDLVRHPYLRLLAPPGMPPGAARDLLRRMERRLGQGTPWVHPRALAEGAVLDLLEQNEADAPPALRTPVSVSIPEGLTALADALISATVEAWARANTPARLADALSALCDLLLTRSGEDAAPLPSTAPGLSGGLTGGLSPETENAALSLQADELWRRFPLDAECLYRLVWRVIPELKDNRMARSVLPWSLLEAMLLELVRAERVPFEADPLTGLQVLGMLETRLLHFSTVHLIDVTEDRLPGAPIRNPLLPDSLRAVLGLPDTRRRDQLAAYTFHRLIAGARDVFLYWQEGVQPSGLFDGKKERSRLVEEMIWEEEQRAGRRFKPGEGPLRAACPAIRPPARRRRCVVKGPESRAALEAVLTRPWSPTRIDAYLTCPLRFYYETICGITPPEEINEGDDPAGVGDLVHTTLRDWYAPWKGRTLDLSAPAERAAAERSLSDCFLKALSASDLPDRLPPESAAMLRVAGPARLVAFLRAQPDKTTILRLEERFTCTLDVTGRERILGGTLDRVDFRRVLPAGGGEACEGAVILDYKTGRIKKIPPAVWMDDSFWDTIFSGRISPDREHPGGAWPDDADAWRPDAADTDDPDSPDMAGEERASFPHREADGPDWSALRERLRDPDPENDVLPLIAARLPSVQLPYYMYLYARATGEDVLDAAFAALGEDGKEAFLFGPAMPEAVREEALNRRIPDLVRLILLHLECCPEFRPREGRHCDWCSWNNLCIMTDPQP